MHQCKTEGMCNCTKYCRRTGNPDWAVKHDGKTEHAEKACSKPCEDPHCSRHTDLYEIHWLQVKEHSHDPGRHGGYQNNDQCISEPFHARTHIQLCQVNSAGNKGKTRDDKKHARETEETIPRNRVK